jgi:hypothetical protein
MEALDGLVALDGELKGFIDDMPPNDRAFSEMTRRLDAQKAVLASEKLVFAAGRSGPSIDRPRQIGSASPSLGPEEARTLDLEPEWIPAHLLEEEADAGRGRRFAWIAAAILLLILVGTAALYVAGLATLPLGALPFLGGE